MQLKLPTEIVDRYGSVIRSLDWDNAESAKLADLFPDAGFAEYDRIERAAFGAGIVIRPATLAAAQRLRAFAQTLPQVPKPTAEDIEAVLKRRNPETAA